MVCWRNSGRKGKGIFCDLLEKCGEDGEGGRKKGFLFFLEEFVEDGERKKEFLYFMEKFWE